MSMKKKSSKQIYNILDISTFTVTQESEDIEIYVGQKDPVPHLVLGYTNKDGKVIRLLSSYNAADVVNEYIKNEDSAKTPIDIKFYRLCMLLATIVEADKKGIRFPLWIDRMSLSNGTFSLHKEIDRSHRDGKTSSLWGIKIYCGVRKEEVSYSKFIVGHNILYDEYSAGVYIKELYRQERSMKGILKRASKSYKKIAKLLIQKRDEKENTKLVA